MRVSCPCCKKRFDVPIRDVLAEAEKLKARGVRWSPTDPNGNVLSPNDLEAKRLRDEAVKRRLGK